MPEKAQNPKAKRQKLPSAVGAMPDPSKFAVTKHYGQAELETPDTPVCSRHPLGTANAPTVQQTEDKGKDVADVAAGVTDEASSSKKLPSELASTSSRRSNFDSNPTEDEEAAVTVPAHANASTIVVGPTDANASVIGVEHAVANASTIAAEATAANAFTTVVDASEISEQIILLSSADEKKQSLTNVNIDVKARLQNREPTPFQDRPNQTDYTSGIGHLKCVDLMSQPEITEGAADYAQVREPPMGIGGIQTQPVTIFFPTVGVDYANGGGDRMATAFLEMYEVEDPEELGVNGLLRRDQVMDDQ